MNGPIHSLNWYAGWWLLLAAFVTGAGLGLFFHRDDFLGGYASFRRRIVRLGHIALAALGMLNLIFSLGPCASQAASVCFVVGGITMPAVCFLTGWRERYRQLFFVPVIALMMAVILTLCGRDGPPGRPQVAKDSARPAIAPYREDGK